eukprot:31184-Pelagococcus_subviridis.AAC.2
MRREKSLRNGVHHADAVVWGPVCRTTTRRSNDGRMDGRFSRRRHPPRRGVVARVASRRVASRRAPVRLQERVVRERVVVLHLLERVRAERVHARGRDRSRRRGRDLARLVLLLRARRERRGRGARRSARRRVPEPRVDVVPLRGLALGAAVDDVAVVGRHRARRGRGSARVDLIDELRALRLSRES